LNSQPKISAPVIILGIKLELRESYRSLELLCRHQAALAPDTRKELESMALEYGRLANWLERQCSEAEIGAN